MKTASPSDWKIEALPSQKADVRLDRAFSAEEMERLKQGLVPAQMEDKWFIYWADNNLFFHRSWTGFCIYVVHFAVSNAGCRMVGADVNRNPEQYAEASDRKDAKMISYLVDVLLLQRESEFPTDEPAGEQAPLAMWSQVGRAMFGQHPDDGAKMTQTDTDSFPKAVASKLKIYVYRLIDPRNGETFYVGKGKGNRVFSHIHAAQNVEGDDLDNKVKRIHEIHLAGFEVAHVIHRHGMDEATALHVEAALIDAYPGLTNIAGGTGSDAFGVMHAREVIQRYLAPVAVFQHKAILINVNNSATERSLYEATRYAWKIKKSKAEQADVVLATRQGEIVGAFIATRWLEATSENFPGRTESPSRLGFEGREASDEIKELYVGKRVPDEYRKPGAANPIKYAWQA